MLPRLEAEERLAAINDGSAAAGTMRRHDSRRMIQRLERAARGGERQKAAKATPAALAQMGIAIVGGPTVAPAEPGATDG